MERRRGGGEVVRREGEEERGRRGGEPVSQSVSPHPCFLGFYNNVLHMSICQMIPVMLCLWAGSARHEVMPTVCRVYMTSQLHMYRTSC